MNLGLRTWATWGSQSACAGRTSGAMSVITAKPNTDDLEGYERWILSSYRQVERGEPVIADSSRKEKRQSAAALREKLRPLQKNIEKTERAMSAVEAEQAELQTRLSDTTLYSEGRKQDLADLLRREGELKARATELEEAWLEQQQALEEISGP